MGILNPQKLGYALVIARFRVQYNQYFPRFSCFAILLTAKYKKKNITAKYDSKQITAKYEKRGKYWPYCAR